MVGQPTRNGRPRSATIGQLTINGQPTFSQLWEWHTMINWGLAYFIENVENKIWIELFWQRVVFCWLRNEISSKPISHMSWGLGPSMQGVMVTRFEGFFVFFLLPSTWPDLPAHPPILEGTKGSVSCVLQYFSVVQLGIIAVWYSQTPDPSVIICPWWSHYAQM